MLIIQRISLTWGKQARSSNFAKVRHQFQMAYPIYNVTYDGQVVIYPFEFVQTEQGIITYEEFIQQQHERYLHKSIFSSSRIQTTFTQGLIVISNYFVLHEGEERCDREGHAVFPFFVGLS